MKRIINVLLVALVLTFVPASYACAQRKVRGESREDLAAVLDDNWKCVFIDKTGKLVIPCQWKGAKYFRNGMAEVKDADGKTYFIDKTGKVVQ